MKLIMELEHVLCCRRLKGGKIPFKCWMGCGITPYKVNITNKETYVENPSILLGRVTLNEK
jgi:hypothetical protein